MNWLDFLAVQKLPTHLLRREWRRRHSSHISAPLLSRAHTEAIREDVQREVSQPEMEVRILEGVFAMHDVDWPFRDGRILCDHYRRAQEKINIEMARLAEMARL